MTIDPGTSPVPPLAPPILPASEPPSMLTLVPRGIRNHNPGNIVRSHIGWRGMADDQSADPHFVVFTEPYWGLRAMALLLRNYQAKHQLCTIDGIIRRWAESREGDACDYVREVADGLGISQHAFVCLDAVTLPQVMRTIVGRENGMQPYPDALITRAVSVF